MFTRKFADKLSKDAEQYPFDVVCHATFRHPCNIECPFPFCRVKTLFTWPWTTERNPYHDEKRKAAEEHVPVAWMPGPLEKWIPRLCFSGAMVFLAYTWFLVIFVDGYAWFPLPKHIQAHPEHYQLALFHYFGEALGLSPGVIEHLQFSLLRFSALSGFVLCFIAARRRDKARVLFHRFLFIGLLLMYYNDSTNYRHGLANRLSSAYAPAGSGRINPIRIGTEIGVYAFIASFMVTALWIWWRKLEKHPEETRYFLLAYGSFFVASTASAGRYIFGIYDTLGNFIVRFFPESFDTKLYEMSAHIPVSHVSHTFWLADWWLEESLEFVGCVGFACFTGWHLLAFLRSLKFSLRTTQ